MGDDLTITKNASSTRQIREVKYIFRHPEYNHWEALNDIAIVKVEAFTETSTLSIASLSVVSPKNNDPCTLAGWGTVKEVHIYC